MFSDAEQIVKQPISLDETKFRIDELELLLCCCHCWRFNVTSCELWWLGDVYDFSIHEKIAFRAFCHGCLSARWNYAKEEGSFIDSEQLYCHSTKLSKPLRHKILAYSQSRLRTEFLSISIATIPFQLNSMSQSFREKKNSLLKCKVGGQVIRFAYLGDMLSLCSTFRRDVAGVEGETNWYVKQFEFIDLGIGWIYSSLSWSFPVSVPGFRAAFCNSVASAAIKVS